MKIILSSSSPRRKEFFKQLGLRGEVVHPEVREIVLGTPVETVVYNAARKVKWVRENKKNIGKAIIMGFDTIVFLEGKIIGKPRDRKDSIRMLKNLSGRWHEVYTGIALLKGEELFQDYDLTRVRFHPLSDSQILYYVHSNRNLDKAGSYGIEDKNMSFIDRIEGSFTNVIGFPLDVTKNLLKEAGISIL
jgi:septum formation protein